MHDLETGIDAAACHSALSEHVKTNTRLGRSYACICTISGRLWSYGRPVQRSNRSKSLGRNPWRTYAMQGHPWGPATEVTVKHTWRKTSNCHVFIGNDCSGRLMSHVFSRVLPPERRRGVKKESHPCLIMYKISRLHESISVTSQRKSSWTLL